MQMSHRANGTNSGVRSVKASIIYSKFDLFKVKSLSLSNFVMAILLFASGLIAAQRFTLGAISAIACIIPFLIFVLTFANKKNSIALTSLALSLFFLVDNGGGVYVETIAPLRYLIYVSAIILLFHLSWASFNKKSLIVAVLLFLGIMISTLLGYMISNAPNDPVTLQRDVTAVLIVSALLLTKVAVQLNVHLLCAGALGFLLGEVLNGLLFYVDFIDYLSYDTLKVFVFFPLIYALLERKNLIVQIALAVVTLYVVFLYGSRMITLSFFALLVAATFINAVKKRQAKTLSIIVLLVALIFNTGILTDNSISELVQFRAISFIPQAIESITVTNFAQILQLLDPVRYAEHELFFARPMFEIMFGSGLGSGVFDEGGLLGFVTYDQTAFSIKEISSSTYFNLHDFWIDFGLRFGLLPIVYLLYRLVLFHIIKGRPWHGVLFGLLILNTTFATSGLIFSVLIIKFFPTSLGNSASHVSVQEH